MGAFNSFRFDITDHLHPPGEDNVVAVRVDFSTDWRHKIPFLPEGYNNYGGIYRDVWVSYTDPAYIESVFITTPELDEAKGRVKVPEKLVVLRLCALAPVAPRAKNTTESPTKITRLRMVFITHLQNDLPQAAWVALAPVCSISPSGFG